MKNKRVKRNKKYKELYRFIPREKKEKSEEEFFEDLCSLDDAAAEAGGYVVYPPTSPYYNVRAIAKKQSKLGRLLTAKELKKYVIHKKII